MSGSSKLSERILGSAVLRVLLGLVSALATGAIFFLSAGRWDLTMGWAVTAVQAVAVVYGALAIDPDLMKERSRPGPGGQDQAMVQIAKLLGVAALVLAGLDVGRFGWSGPMPPIVQWLGLAAFAAGMGIALWSMAINRYFSSVVRIQEDRGHELITDGPYAVVRHPGYAGILIGMPGMALALGSWVALIPQIVFDLLIFRRLLIEERVLRQELAGYVEYSQRVRWRLLPGLW